MKRFLLIFMAVVFFCGVSLTAAEDVKTELINKTVRALVRARENYPKISVGMSAQDVIGLLGEPFARETGPANKEIAAYHVPGYKSVGIFYLKGRVSKIEENIPGNEQQVVDHLKSRM